MSLSFQGAYLPTPLAWIRASGHTPKHKTVFAGFATFLPDIACRPRSLCQSASEPLTDRRALPFRNAYLPFSCFFQIRIRPGINDYSNEIMDVAIAPVQATAKGEGQNVFCAMRSQCSRTATASIANRALFRIVTLAATPHIGDRPDGTRIISAP